MAIHNSAAEGNDYSVCPTCDRVFSGFEPYQLPGGLTIDDEEDADGEVPDIPNGYVSKGLDARGFEPKTKDSTWVTRSDYEEGFLLAPSAKTAALKAALIKGFNEAPVDKASQSPGPLPSMCRII